jgi:hypothetical protein
VISCSCIFFLNQILFFLFFTFLLTHTSFKGGSHCDISICAHNVPWLNSPFHNSPSLFLPLLKKILNEFYYSIFQTCIHIYQPYSLSFTLSTHSPLSHRHLPLSRPVLPSCTLFSKCTLIVQRDLVMVFHTCIHCNWIRLALYYSLFLYPLAP